MTNSVQTITVYGASSSKVDPVYLDAARKLGELLAKQDVVCINGAGANGLMAAISNGSLAQGGKVIGIIPQFMVDAGWKHHELTEVIVTPDMHTRKQLMASKSDACIALPGGIGTMEELLEVMTWKQLGLYSKPIVILNINGYYDPLLSMMDKAEKENFIHHKHHSIWDVANTPEDALKIAMEQREWHHNPISFAAL